MKSRTRNRRTGRVVDVLPSKSAGFCAIFKDDDGTPYFAYGRSFLSHPSVPRVGHVVEFTVLPPSGSGPLQRATEIQVKRPTKGGDIKIERGDGFTRLLLRTAGQNRLLGELQI